jgi:hypothetical protein
VAVDGLGRILLADTGRRIRGRLKIPVDDGVYGVDVTVVRWDERL